MCLILFAHRCRVDLPLLLAEREFAGSPECWSQRSFRLPIATDHGNFDPFQKAKNTCSTADKIG